MGKSCPTDDCKMKRSNAAPALRRLTPPIPLTMSQFSPCLCYAPLYKLPFIVLLPCVTLFLFLLFLPLSLSRLLISPSVLSCRYFSASKGVLLYPLLPLSCPHRIVMLLCFIIPRSPSLLCLSHLCPVLASSLVFRCVLLCPS